MMTENCQGLAVETELGAAFRIVKSVMGLPSSCCVGSTMSAAPSRTAVAMIFGRIYRRGRQLRSCLQPPEKAERDERPACLFLRTITLFPGC